MSRTISSIRRLARTIGGAAGALLFGTVLPMAAALADEDGYPPDPSTLFPISSVTGFPPYSPEVVTGYESWNFLDFTTNQVLVPDQLLGADTETIFGSLTNNDFSNGDFTIDFANFGGGWANNGSTSPAPAGSRRIY